MKYSFAIAALLGLVSAKQSPELNQWIKTFKEEDPQLWEAEDMEAFKAKSTAACSAVMSHYKWKRQRWLTSKQKMSLCVKRVVTRHIIFHKIRSAKRLMACKKRVKAHVKVVEMDKAMTTKFKKCLIKDRLKEQCKPGCEEKLGLDEITIGRKLLKIQKFKLKICTISCSSKKWVIFEARKAEEAQKAAMEKAAADKIAAEKAAAIAAEKLANAKAVTDAKAKLEEAKTILKKTIDLIVKDALKRNVEAYQAVNAKNLVDYDQTVVEKKKQRFQGLRRLRSLGIFISEETFNQAKRGLEKARLARQNDKQKFNKENGEEHDAEVALANDKKALKVAKERVALASKKVEEAQKRVDAEAPSFFLI